MESWFDFLFHASVGFSLFFILYWLLLRQSTHFRANRVYLLISIVLALLVSAFPFHYTATLQSPTHLPILTGALNRTGITDHPELDSNKNMWHLILLFVYLTGAILFALRLLIQTWKPLQIIYRSPAQKQGNYFIHDNDNYALPFSFFNHILINTNYLKQEEISEILAHEQVHIRERHWIDLLIIELLTVIFWFNPFIWLFELAIKQNHEYLADQGVISRGHSPVRYQALLVNQLLGMQVIGLTNNLNFALGPTRLNMMKRQKTSKTKLFRMAWGIPILTFMLVGFAEPNYQTAAPVTNNVQPATKQIAGTDTTQMIHGTVVNEQGDPLKGTVLIIPGTKKGTIASDGGKFSLEVPEKGCDLAVMFIDYQKLVTHIDPQKKDNYTFRLEKEKVADASQKKHTDKAMKSQPGSGKTNNLPIEKRPVFFIVEKMPEYPGGGDEALKEYIESRKKKILKNAESEGKNLKGKAYVNFVIQTDGSVDKIKIAKSSGSRYTDEKAIEIVKGMAKWSPGKQRGKAVPVSFTVPVEF